MQDEHMTIDPRELDTASLAFFAGDAANRLLLARIRAAGHPQVRIAHGYLIQHLVERSPTVGELAAALGVTQQAASKSTRELQDLGYLVRRPDLDDGRVTRLELSARGRDVVATARRIRSEFEDELRDAVDGAALVTAREVLASLLDITGGARPVRERAVPAPEQ
jgi:DNA-binding MarR family transcriptional regulator